MCPKPFSQAVLNAIPQRFKLPPVALPATEIWTIGSPSMWQRVVSVHIPVKKNYRAGEQQLLGPPKLRKQRSIFVVNSK